MTGIYRNTVGCKRNSVNLSSRGLLKVLNNIVSDYFYHNKNIILKAKINLDLSDEVIEKFSRYLNCVEHWEKTHNIVSNKFSREELLENLFDSAVGGASLLFENHIYDAGSGGGFPGIVLGILYPEIRFILIESNRKKCSFLRLVKNILILDNVSIENKRIEEFEELSYVISKAAFSPSNINVLWEALAEKGKLALWATPKSKQSFESVLEKKSGILLNEFEYSLPKGQQRSILLFTKSSGTIVPRGTK